MNLGTGYITTKGAELIADILNEGGMIQWTRCTITSQNISGYTAAQLKALTSITETLNGTVETSISSETKNKIYLSCRFDNEEVTTGFSCYGFAIFGKKAGGAETLIYIAPASGTVYTMNAANYGLTRMYINAAIQVTDASITGISVNQSGGMATADALQDEVDARESLEAVTVKTNTGQTITGQKTFTSANGLTTTSVYPNSATAAGSYDLGSGSKPWRNIYVNNISTTNTNYPVNVSRNLEPDTTNTRNLGNTSKLWNNAYIKSIYASTSINPTTTEVATIGTTENRWKEINTKDLNASDIEADYANIEEIITSSLDISGGANIQGDLFVRDNITTNVFTTSAITTGSISATGTIKANAIGDGTRHVNSAIIDTVNVGIIIKSASGMSGAADLGNEVFYFKNGYINTLNKVLEQSAIHANGNFEPSVDTSYNLGSSSYKWNEIYCNSIKCGSITPNAGGTYDLGTSSNAWRSVYCGSISSYGITPRIGNSYSLGSSSYLWSNLYCNSLSGCRNALIAAIAPTSSSIAVGQIGLFAYKKSVTSTTTSNESAGSSVAGSSLAFANIYKGPNNTSVMFDTNGTISGTYRIMNSIYWFTGTTGEQISLVLAIRTA